MRKTSTRWKSSHLGFDQAWPATHSVVQRSWLSSCPCSPISECTPPRANLCVSHRPPRILVRRRRRLGVSAGVLPALTATMLKRHWACLLRLAVCEGVGHIFACAALSKGRPCRFGQGSGSLGRVYGLSRERGCGRSLLSLQAWTSYRGLRLHRKSVLPCLHVAGVDVV